VKKIVAMIVVMMCSMIGSALAQSQSTPQPLVKSNPAGVVAQGRTLIISTVERQPFIFYNEGGKVSGFSADLWMEIARRNNWQFTWKREDSFPDLVNSVKMASSDAGIANISITSEREKIFDFSHPIYDSGMQIIVPDKDSGINIFRLIWESGALQLIAIAILVLLVIAHVLWFFERNIENPRHDYFRDDYKGGVWDAFWWAFIIMTMGGFENEVPYRKLSRVLAMFWIVISLFFVSTLTAKITTSLTVDRLTSDINSYNDLIGKKVGVGANSAMSKFLDVKNISYRRYKDFKESLAAVIRGEIDATIGDAPVVQYYASHQGAGKVLLAGPVFQPDKFGIALPTGSSLMERVNTVLLELREDGTYERLQVKWFGRSD
jgi:polar amino acid transport system substrate-binding protein